MKINTNTETVGALTPEQKRFATLKAQAALHGIAVHQLADGGYLVCRWNMTKDVPDLDALSRFLHTMGVRNG
jgi:hypothetical protein